jgi:hypothetical protein
MMSESTLRWAETQLSTLLESAPVVGLSRQSILNWRNCKLSMDRERQARLEKFVIARFMELAKIIGPHIVASPGQDVQS